ncbi:MAG TPA: YfiR family protein [Acidobacteriaceae bacterium]|nr:YfiR family protein [Acidobacteriaceae bacterium]
MESLKYSTTIRLWLRFALAMCVGLALAPGGGAQATMPDEYHVRAAIIVNLTKFVVWPPSKTADPHAPFVVGLLGYDEQSDAVERAFTGRLVDGRPVAVRRIGHSDRMDDCFLVYVALPEQKHYDEVAPELTRAGVLTVSDDERFVFNGGVVGLPVTGDHIQIQINLAHAQSSGLAISSRLLQLATVVGR